MNQRNLGPDNQSNNKKMGHVNYIVSSKKKKRKNFLFGSQWAMDFTWIGFDNYLCNRVKLKSNYY